MGGDIEGDGVKFSAPAEITLEVVKEFGIDGFVVKNLKDLPAKYNRSIVLDLPGEASAWQFNIKSIDRQNNIVKLDRPHGLQHQNNRWLRTYYQRHEFDGKALLKAAAPSVQ